jgi:hypothetical protein
LTVVEVTRRADKLDRGQLNTVLEYGRSNRNRKTLVARLSRMVNKRVTPAVPGRAV